MFESLVKAGAFDSLAKGDPSLSSLPSAALRARLFAGLDAACEHGGRHQRDRDEGQAQLFGFGDEHRDAGGGAVPLPAAPPWTETEQLGFEKETLGLYWSGHPVDRYAQDLKALGSRLTTELADQPVTSRTDSWGAGGPKPIEPDTSVGGIVAACRPLKTRKGDRMAVFTLEDALGGVEVVVFPDTFQRSGGLIETGRMVLVSGRLERDDETVRIIASEIVSIDIVRERLAREVAIRVSGPLDAVAPALREVFLRHRGDRRVLFELETADHLRVRMDVSSQIRVRPSPALVAEVEQIVGLGSVSLR